jgi:hypothetical protein
MKATKLFATNLIIMLVLGKMTHAQCTLTIDSVISKQVSCFGQSDGSITVYASGNNGNMNYSNGSGGQAIVPEATFEAPNELSTTGGSGPTDRWWSPSSCNNGVYFKYSANQGCPAGSALFAGGFSGFAGCFLRSPRINMNGIDQVTVTMDVTHGYNASRPNDRLRFYVWVNNAYLSTPALFTINGAPGNNLNFNQIRNCETVTVSIDLSGVGSNNRSDFNFYIEANCQYNNCSAYQVSVDNIQISQGQAFQISETFSGLAPGAYPITVKDASGCSASLNTPVLITEPNAVTPLISLDGALLSTDSYASYQWYLDGVLLEGATEQQYIITANGNYTVSVIDANNCGGTSAPYAVLTTQLSGQQLTEILQVRPNPFGNELLLQWHNARKRKIELCNLSGQVMLSIDCNTHALNLPAETLPAGIYLLNVTDEGGKYSKLLVKSAD